MDYEFEDKYCDDMNHSELPLSDHIENKHNQSEEFSNIKKRMCKDSHFKEPSSERLANT